LRETTILVAKQTVHFRLISAQWTQKEKPPPGFRQNLWIIADAGNNFKGFPGIPIPAFRWPGIYTSSVFAVTFCAGRTDETPQMTEQAKINISPLPYAILLAENQ